MSLDNIYLSKKITSALYKDLLVDAKQSENVFPRYKFLGNNQKQITFVVQSHDVVFVEEKHLSFITKMLEACKMNIGDIASSRIMHLHPLIFSNSNTTIAPTNAHIQRGIESTRYTIAFQFPAI